MGNETVIRRAEMFDSEVTANVCAATGELLSGPLTVTQLFAMAHQMDVDPYRWLPAA